MVGEEPQITQSTRRERTNDLTQFGWQVNGVSSGELYKKAAAVAGSGGKSDGAFSLEKTNDLPPGYKQTLLYGVTDVSPEAWGGDHGFDVAGLYTRSLRGR